jgi:hypothetical protein
MTDEIPPNSDYRDNGDVVVDYDDGAIEASYTNRNDEGVKSIKIIKK